MKRISFILLFLPALLQAQNLRRWGSTGSVSTLHGNWFYNAHPSYTLADSLKLVDLRLLKDTAAALRSAMSSGSGMSIGGAVTSGTTGSILFIGSSSALTQDNSNFFWDNSNKRLGIGTNSPSYRVDIFRAATGQTASYKTLNISTTGSTFNMTSAAYNNHAGYFSADASVSTGAFDLTNIGVEGMATGGTFNWGIVTSNTSYTGKGLFYQSANNTTKVEGGPSTDNMQFGPDNRIRFNTGNAICSGSLSAGAANSDDGIGALQAWGRLTVHTIDSTSSPANILYQDPVTFEIKKAAVPSGGVTLASGTYTPTLTNESNITSSTAYQCMYHRVGNIVTVSGKINVDYTATGTATLGISLPIASDIANDYDAAGVMHAEVNAGGVIRGDATNNRAQFYINTGSSAGFDYFFTFTYIVQ
jgi:hypothetical protein